ncbi:MAG: radical SAM protein [Clostridia bacterium]
MKAFTPNWTYNPFSHIYVEEDAFSHPAVRQILDRFPDAVTVPIHRYTDILNRPRQDYQHQKKALQLILALERDRFLYKGPAICQDYGHPNFYYASSALNCIYDCHYCFLQGMYSSAHLVVFVNLEDFFREVDKSLQEGPVYLCTSYDSDLLALERLIPHASAWIHYARERKDLLMEIRTKSSAFDAIRSIPPVPNVLLAWTLSPDPVIEAYEKKTPSLSRRLDAIRKALDAGWPVRICLEPILRIPNWQEVYSAFWEKILDQLPISRIVDINIGMLRMNRDYFKKIQKGRLDNDLFTYPMEANKNVMSYPAAQEEEMKGFLLEKIAAHYPKERIYIS